MLALVLEQHLLKLAADDEMGRRIQDKSLDLVGVVSAGSPTLMRGDICRSAATFTGLGIWSYLYDHFAAVACFYDLKVVLVEKVLQSPSEASGALNIELVGGHKGHANAGCVKDVRAGFNGWVAPVGRGWMRQLLLVFLYITKLPYGHFIPTIYFLRWIVSLPLSQLNFAALFLIMNATIIDKIARSSVHIIMLDASKTSCGFGSGCLVRYQEKIYLLSVAHVTNIASLSACLETNEPQEGEQSLLYCVGAMSYFDEVRINPSDIGKPGFLLEELLEKKAKPIDVTFCRVRQVPILRQQAWDFGAYQIAASDKLVLDLEETARPEKGKQYGFCGRVRQQLDGNYLRVQPTLKLGLEYRGDKDRLHYFAAPEVITDKADYQGCSGAPILDEEGRLVGLAQSILTNSKVVYGFSIAHCKKLLDTAIHIGLVD